MGRPNTNYLILLALGSLCSSVAACAADELQTETNNANNPMPIDKQISWVHKDLAARLDIDSSEIMVETARAVHWRSGAAGCPDPNMSYTMAIVPGVLFILKVGDEIHRYHSGRDGRPFYCPADRAEAPALGQGAEIM